MQLRGWWCQSGEEVWREDQVWEEGDESKVLFCTQLHVLCLPVIYGEFGQTNWSADKRSRLEIVSLAIWGCNELKRLSHTWGSLMSCASMRNK